MTAVVVGRRKVGSNVGVNIMNKLTDGLGKMGLLSPHRSAPSLRLPTEDSISKAVNKFSPSLKIKIKKKADKQVPHEIVSSSSSSSSSKGGTKKFRSTNRATCGGDWR